jgi:hypothetical protein
MSEIEKLYKCVFDKAYLNKVELSILLDSLSDRKLAKGFVNSLCLSSTGYEIDESYKRELLFLYIEAFGPSTTDDIKESAYYFTTELRKVSDSNISETQRRVESLGVVVEYIKSDKDKAILEKYDLELLKGIKRMLLELEMYNDIIIIDELINKSK